MLLINIATHESFLGFSPHKLRSCRSFLPEDNEGEDNKPVFLHPGDILLRHHPRLPCCSRSMTGAVGWGGCWRRAGWAGGNALVSGMTNVLSRVVGLLLGQGRSVLRTEQSLLLLRDSFKVSSSVRGPASPSSCAHTPSPPRGARGAPRQASDASCLAGLGPQTLPMGAGAAHGLSSLVPWGSRVSTCV